MGSGQISDDISAKFANMGFLCACLVVLMHVKSPWEGGGISEVAVPFFFAASGYFLAGKPWRHEVAKRVRTLLIPLFFWCAVWAVVTIPLAMALNCRATRPLMTNVFHGWDTLRYLALDPFHQPAMGPLWYLRCLFIFVLVSPLLSWGIRRIGMLLPVAMGILYFLFPQSWHIEKLFVFGFSIEGLFYFCCGMWLKLKSVPLRLDIRLGIGILIVGLASFVAGYHCIAIPCIIPGLWSVMPSRRFPDFLVSNAFPIYLVHMLVLLSFGRHRVESAILALGVWLMTLALSLMAAVLSRRFFPRVTSLAFGGR